MQDNAIQSHMILMHQNMKDGYGIWTMFERIHTSAPVATLDAAQSRAMRRICAIE